MNPQQQEGNIGRNVGADTVFAHAPYNFVPLPEQAVTVALSELPDHDRYSGLTGVIECELETLSPTYVRGLLSPDDFADFGDKEYYKLNDDAKKRRAKFFAVGSQLRIPGSSLRGMTRALVEIASFGKMHFVGDGNLVFRAVGDTTSLGAYYRELLLGNNKAAPPKVHLDYPLNVVKGGYLRKVAGEWRIQPAQVHKGESFVHVEYNDANAVTHGSGRQKTYPVYVAPANRLTTRRSRPTLELDLALTSKVIARSGSSTLPSGMVEATLIESGSAPRKHMHCAVYAPDSSIANDKFVQIPDEMWHVYEEDRDMTRSTKLPTRKLEHDGDPLFYLVDHSGQLIFFGSTMMFRLTYGQSVLAFVPNSLREEGDLDIAEAIFGYVKSNKLPVGKARSCAGRISFGEAQCQPEQGNIFVQDQSVLTPKILGSPKLTTFQHYLVQTDLTDKRALNHYASKPKNDTVLRGHKLFWHRGNPNAAELSFNGDAEDSKKQLTGIKPIRSGMKFTFTIRFENLRDYELGALLWVLKLPEGCAHKLGMGKPLGMGSVRVSVKSMRMSTRTISADAQQPGRYQRLFDTPQTSWHTAEHADAPTPYIQAFENFVLSRISPDEGTAQHFIDLPRVRDLLLMLQFPGPENQKTEYMQIEHPIKKNEYKERPVLPTPAAVMNLIRATRQPNPIRPSPSGPGVGQIQLPAASSDASITPPEIREGIVLKIDTSNSRRGRVRDGQSNKEYGFETKVIQGNAPGTKSANSSVTFGLQGGKVVWLKRK